MLHSMDLPVTHTWHLFEKVSMVVGFVQQFPLYFKLFFFLGEISRVDLIDIRLQRIRHRISDRHTLESIVTEMGV